MSVQLTQSKPREQVVSDVTTNALFLKSKKTTITLAVIFAVIEIGITYGVIVSSSLGIGLTVGFALAGLMLAEMYGQFRTVAEIPRLRLDSETGEVKIETGWLWIKKTRQTMTFYGLTSLELDVITGLQMIKEGCLSTDRYLYILYGHYDIARSTIIRSNLAVDIETFANALAKTLQVPLSQTDNYVKVKKQKAQKEK